MQCEAPHTHSDRVARQSNWGLFAVRGCHIAVAREYAAAASGLRNEVQFGFKETLASGE